jgi:XrtN system VIT domain protein
MTTTQTSPFKVSYLTGLAMSLVSFLIYLFTPRTDDDFGIFSGTFFVNYGMAIIYMIILLINKLRLSSPRPNITFGCWSNAVILFTISAFSLNKEMHVFANFPTWLNIYTLAVVGLFFSFPYIHHFPNYLKIFFYVLTGAALTLAVYMALFICPLVPLSGLVFWFFGFSLHTFVPYVWIWLIIAFLVRKSDKPRLKHFLWAGVVLPLLILAFYLNKWNNIQTQIKDILAEKNLQVDHELPNDIILAQKLPSDPMTDEILITPFKSQRFFGESDIMNNGEEKKFHDPLSLIASEFLGSVDLDLNTTETLLNIRKNYRNSTRERLWTGTSLSTISISNNIKLFPDYRMAYHEKTLVIHNDKHKNDRSWFSAETEEALYTFHIPEGSVVTSLSLWINGKEEKSRLTTSRKADSAYTQIVGVQRRDPAIVHWQEGNAITVNVFPCTTTEDRTFKIGFTCPLRLEEGKMWLENVWFEGPDFSGAREATQVMFAGKQIRPLELPNGFEDNASGNYIYKGEYNHDWKMAFDIVPLSKNKFSFNGNDYVLKEIAFKEVSQPVSKVYLDVTKEWTKEEYEDALTDLKGKEIYTWLPGKVKITEENKEKVWNEVSINHFSMPFLYDIKNPEATVILTKAGKQSPILNDVKESSYAQETTKYLLETKGIVRVINFGEEISPLWRSLHELRLIDYQKCHLKTGIEQINKGKFLSATEDSSTISLVESRMSLVKSNRDSSVQSLAPDHLIRLFAYNDVLRKIGKRYFEKEKYEEELFRETEEGYVVTPISSMIVLETKEDYDKMGIHENQNTVGNAGILGGGAVPEPHEWLLIILVFLFISRQLYLKYKSNILNFIRK